MDINSSMDICRAAFLCSLQIAGPLLLASLVAGTLAGLLQSLLRIHDMTPALVARLVVTGGTAVVLLPWLLETIRQFATTAWSVAPLR